MCDIDSSLRQRHLDSLKYPESREMYDRTLALCRDRPDGVQGTDLDMIFDLCTAEDVKHDLKADIKSRGVVVETRNGRQIFRKENPSMARLCRYTELQRKIRADLRITPAKRAAPEEEEEPEEEEDAFDAL